MTAGDIRIITGDHSSATKMSGIVCAGANDYLQIDALATHEAGANNTMGTMSCWVNFPDTTEQYSAFSIGVDAEISHIDIEVNAGIITAYSRSNNVEQFKIESSEKITPHKWHHIAMTHDGVRPRIYLDGVRCTETDTVSTNLTFWMNDLATWDKSAIGILSMNSGTVFDCDGGITYVKYSTGTTSAAVWTPEEVKAEYDYRGGLGVGSGKTPNLCTWILDNSLVETTTGGGTYDATIVSDVQFDTEFSSFTSKLRLLAPVVADDTNILSIGGGGYIAAVVKAA